MGRALALPLRSQIVEQKQGGKTVVAIALAWPLSYATVCRGYRRFTEKGAEGLAACYQRCGTAGTKSDGFIQRTSVGLLLLSALCSSSAMSSVRCPAPAPCNAALKRRVYRGSKAAVRCSVGGGRACHRTDRCQRKASAPMR